MMNEDERRLTAFALLPAAADLLPEHWQPRHTELMETDCEILNWLSRCYEPSPHRMSVLAMSSIFRPDFLRQLVKRAETKRGTGPGSLWVGVESVVESAGEKS